MSYEEDFDEELGPVKSKSPASKTHSSVKKVQFILHVPNKRELHS